MARRKVTPIRPSEEEPVEIQEGEEAVAVIPDFVKVPVNLIENLLNQEEGGNRVGLKTTVQEIRVLYQDQILKPDSLQVNYPDQPDNVKPLSGS